MRNINNTKKRRNGRGRKGGEGEVTSSVQSVESSSLLPQSVNDAVSSAEGTVSGAATELYNGASNAVSSVSNAVSGSSSSSSESGWGKFVSGWTWPKRDPNCKNWFTSCEPSTTIGGKSRKFRKRTQRNLYKKTPKMNFMNGLLKVFTCGRHTRKRPRNNKKQMGGTPLYLQPFADPQGKQLPHYTPHAVLQGGSAVPYLKAELVEDKQANFDPNGNSYLIGGKKRNRRYKK